MSDRSVERQDRDVWELIQSFNRERDSNILTQKYLKMRENAFVFFRGSCHLFYQDLPQGWGAVAPSAWICGDLHLENFGTYKGDNRQIYFGIDDFDEGVLAPCIWDITRLVTSIILAADSWGCDRSELEQLVQIYLTSYASTLVAGNIRAIGEDDASGVVADLIKRLSRRKRRDLLDERTELNDDCRQLKFDDAKILKISTQRRQEVIKVIADWAQTQANPDFFKVLDVGFRVAGTGSLGLDRYLILVVGKGSPDRNYLLDFKQQQSACVQTSATPQPLWANDATRVMQVQRLVQFVSPALLAAIPVNERSYLLRELQPTQDKITLKNGSMNLDSLKKLIHTMGKVTATTHLHGSGELGAATIEALSDFGNNLDWQQEVITYTNNYARQVQIDYQDFCKATKYL